MADRDTPNHIFKATDRETQQTFHVADRDTPNHIFKAIDRETQQTFHVADRETHQTKHFSQQIVIHQTTYFKRQIERHTKPNISHGR
jgi:hypothetical protein